ncbi:MAG: LytTR family DNA-binding domain-containing protein [Oscillospiraceae bacterium]|nr:LytTR family DNA-binding domain-containing protein [Oscillospiraceae bacterium]
MWVAICDDEQHFLDSLKAAIYEYSSKHRLGIAIDEFSCGQDLLDSERKYDLVFLDYKMDGIDGLETARRLRSSNYLCAIIFITAYPQIAVDAYKVETFRVLTKPLDIEALNTDLDAYFGNAGRNYTISIKENRYNRSIKTQDIIFLKAENKCCHIILGEEEVFVSRTLSSMGSQLPSWLFCRVSKSHIVNLSYIKEYSREEICLKNKVAFPIGRRYFNDFVSMYIDYHRERAR